MVNISIILNYKVNFDLLKWRFNCNMRILQIPNYIYPHIGGIEQTAFDILNALKEKSDIEQRVICFNGANKTENDLLENVKITRVKSIAKFASQELAFSYGKELNKVLKEFKPDIVIFHYPNPLVAHYLLKHIKNASFKLILYWHLDITKQKILGKLFTRQSNKLLEYATKIIATSPNYAMGSKFLIKHKDKVKIIPSCVNNEKLVINNEILLKSKCIKEKYNGKTIVFAFGRHIPYKGLTYLIQASKELDNDFAVLIGGKGELTDKLKKEAKDDNKIEFLGVLSEDDLKAHLYACDIFAFPSISKNEAFGLGLAEAMAYNKPCVTFTIKGSGVNYVSLDGVTGFEVENKDAVAFKDALVKLKEHEDLRKQFGVNAYNRFKELFTEKQFEVNIQNLIEELI